MIKYPKPIIIANWKMNHNFESSEIWLDKFFNNFLENRHNIKKITTILCPPATLLDYIDSEILDETIEEVERVSQEKQLSINNAEENTINKIIYEEKLIRLGAQNCHYQLSGSFTGEISLNNIQEVGCEFVIIGHSEVRQYHNEDDKIIAKKLLAVVDQGIIPIICIGETLETRNQGNYQQFIIEQISQIFYNSIIIAKHIIIAYEPIWAIGSGKLPTITEITEIASIIKKEVNNLKNKQIFSFDADISILYGGSVTSKNSQEILAIDNIDGLLVGKASLVAEDFINICNNIPNK